MTRKYSDSERYEIINKLNSLGVYDFAIETTLRKQGYSKLHDDIVEGTHEDYKAIIFYPRDKTSKEDYNENVYQCSKVYQLYVKEMHLQQRNVFYTPSQYIINAMNDNKTWVEDSTDLPISSLDYNKRVVVAMDDFYHGFNFSMTQENVREVMTMERYLLYLIFNRGYLLVLQSECHPSEIEGYWTKNFVNTLVKHSKIVEVTA